VNPTRTVERTYQFKQRQGNRTFRHRKYLELRISAGLLEKLDPKGVKQGAKHPERRMHCDKTPHNAIFFGICRRAGLRAAARAQRVRFHDSLSRSLRALTKRESQIPKDRADTF